MGSTDVRPAAAPASHVEAPAHPRLALAGRVVTALAVVPAAVLSALGLVEGDRAQAVLPVAVAAALALGVLALTRFGAFVLVALAVRPSLDLVKLSRGDSGVERWLDPSSLLSLLLLVAAVAWLATQVASGRPLRGSPLRTALLLLAAAALVSVLTSSQPQAGAVEALRLVSVVTMFVVLEQLVTDRAGVVRVLVAVFAGLAVPLLYTAAGYALGSPSVEVGDGLARLTGPFDKSNTFARYLALVLVLGVALLPALRRRLQVLLGLALAASAVFLVLTLTRGAVAGAVAGVLVVALAQRRVRLVALLVGAGALALVAVPGLGTRYAALGLDGGTEGNGLRWRLDYWSQVVPLVQENPLTGIGLGTTALRTAEGKEPHGDVVRALVETGVLGLLAYLAVHVTLALTALRALRRTTRGSLEHAVAAGALGATACFAVGSLGGNLVTNVVGMWVLMAVAALASAIARDART